MIRSKDTSAPRSSAQRHPSFAFRRIQARELYESAAQAETTTARVTFRLRLHRIGRTLA